MSVVTITGLDAVLDANLTDAAVFETEDSGGDSRKATLAQIRTRLLTTSSATDWSLGPNGQTNPVWQVDCSTASQAAGLKLTGATSAGTVALAVISSGSNANLSINAKGSGTVSIGGTSTGNITIGAVFVVAQSTGNLTTGTVNSQTISSSANFTGSVTVANGFTVSAGTSAMQAVTATTVVATGGVSVSAGQSYAFASRGNIAATADGIIGLFDNAGTSFGRLNFGGSTSSFPSLKRSSTTLIARLADDSGDAPFTAAALTCTTITASSTINSQTISASANFTGSVTVANGFTVSAGTSALQAVTATTVTTTGLLQVTLTTEQARLRYDSDTYLSITVNSTADTTYDAVSGGGIASHVFSIGGSVYAKFDNQTIGGGLTNFYLYDQDNAALEQVSVGDADSGGSGYKVLRIAN